VLRYVLSSYSTLHLKKAPLISDFYLHLCTAD
jgi:hypothetical protein